MLRKIEPCKSVMNFTDEEVLNTIAFQNQFFDELKEKSPYIRRLHDWRIFEESPVEVITVENNNKTIDDFTADLKQKTTINGKESYRIFRGEVTNTDTGFQILVTGKGLDETRHNIRRDSNRYRNHDFSAIINAAYNVALLCQNGVLLDTATLVMKPNKSPNGLFMHYFYSPFVFDGRFQVAKLFIQEIVNIAARSNTKNLYSIADIKIVPNASGFGDAGITQPLRQLGTEISVSQLFAFVKAFDKNFYINLRHKF
jgi:hypothetical protein